ncbi:MAG: hypothetical protein SXG53_21395 [Pseudomonadota bacterium]|nr:hypothetical protein [Pseudomonadota bacterium]
MTHFAIAEVLSAIPQSHRDPLLETFATIVRNYRESRWEPSELNGGKFSEVVYSILSGHVTGEFAPRPEKPRNMVAACKALENHSSDFPRAITIQIPRMLVALYEIRNNRGVGHVGGDVNPNHMDARVVVEMAKWVLAELVRVFHPTSMGTEEAAALVEAIADRTVPVVWKAGDVLRVLDPKLSMRDQTLLLLYSVNAAVTASELFRWVEHSNFSVYKRDVLRRAHVARLVEYNEASGSVSLSPLGVREVEAELPLLLPA